MQTDSRWILKLGQVRRNTKELDGVPKKQYSLHQWTMKGNLKLTDKPGSVPALQRVTVIHLGTRLPARSSSLPDSGASHAIAVLFGLAPDGGYRVSRPPCGILVSVALFLASRRTAVSRHPALRSPDFPPLMHHKRRLSGQLQIAFYHTNFQLNSAPARKGTSSS